MPKKAKKNRPNPTRIPVSQADVDRAKRAARDEACVLAWAIIFMVLRDKFKFTEAHCGRLWAAVEKYSTEVKEGRVSVPDMLQVLREEAGIDLHG